MKRGFYPNDLSLVAVKGHPTFAAGLEEIFPSRHVRLGPDCVL